MAGTEVGDIPRMTWHDAMERYGSDKPDVRFGMELVELTDVFAGTGSGVRRPDREGHPGAGRRRASRRRLDDLTEKAKRWGAKGLVWMRVQDDALDSPVAKFLSDDESAGIRAWARRARRATCCCSSPTTATSCATCSACCESNSAGHP